jgi:DNA invertase Pin-like site-specific DNA recombinase
MKTLRCAIYTRKSSEEGLEQDFNSLHAQREACEAYILSQAGEGWTPLKTAYDDGGISGGTMERPGLKQLLADIAAGRVDVVVVYKVDRLTRSLTDFAKIVDVFDKHGASFVSVTQAFNTTSSMGRLTLNVLLSFAQFEREVTGERIRDKIAASKKKGMWMGGALPLGYDADGRTLKINEPEAEQVRHIYRRYLEVKSVHRLAEELEAEGYRSKVRTLKNGETRGGEVMSRGALFHLLSNRHYLGLIPHKQEVYPGLHKPIVRQEVFEAAQALIKANSVKRTTGSARRTESALVGKLFDEDGELMSPTFAEGRRGGRYRYYVSTSLQRGRRAPDDGKLRRLPGPELERAVSGLMERLTDGEAVLRQVKVRPGGLELTLSAPPDVHETRWAHELGRINTRLRAGERAWLTNSNEIVAVTATALTFRGGRAWIEGEGAPPLQRIDRGLVSTLRRAQVLAARGAFDAVREVALPKNVRRLLELAFLAPDIQQAILEGRQPPSLTVASLRETRLPTSWAEQRSHLGFAAKR